MYSDVNSLNGFKLILSILFGFLIFWIYVLPLNSFKKDIAKKHFVIWNAAFICFILSSFFATCYFLIGGSFGSIASVFLMFSTLMIGLCIRSYRIEITYKFLWALLLILSATLIYIYFDNPNLSLFDEKNKDIIRLFLIGFVIWECIQQQNLKLKGFFRFFIACLIFHECLVLTHILFYGYGAEFIHLTVVPEDEEGFLSVLIRLLGIASSTLSLILLSQFFRELQSLKQSDLIQDSRLKLASGLKSLALARDNETGNHIARTQIYVEKLARRMQSLGYYPDQLSESYIEDMALTAPLHDLGKVGIPDAILHKPGKLNDEEWGVMRTHPQIGETVLESIKKTSLNSDNNFMIDTAIGIVVGHHEKWDGSGYPYKLQGEQIPLAARIMSLADMYDALVNKRAYKPAWTHEAAIEEIVRLRGSQFDPKVVDAFELEQQEFKVISDRMRDLDEAA